MGALAGWIKRGLKANLATGVLVLTPIAATLFFLQALVRWVDKVLLLLPPPYRPGALLPFEIPGLGFLLLAAILLLVGFLVRNFMGRAVVGLGEAIVNRIPFVSTFYNAVKQLVETIVSGSGRDFKRVVLVEYPRKGVYALAFVTGIATGEIQEKTAARCLNVFLPTTPNPTSGFYLLVPEEECIPLAMSVEDAFKLLISGGILSPDSASRKQGKRAADAVHQPKEELQ
ncbi:MAG: DUF502 domain-containing protein [Desulfovibrionaceae bacterium]